MFSSTRFVCFIHCALQVLKTHLRKFQKAEKRAFVTNAYVQLNGVVFNDIFGVNYDTKYHIKTHYNITKLEEVVFFQQNLLNTTVIW